jgi:2-iminobutanoate/2-iminopropanoate deaminase
MTSEPASNTVSVVETGVAQHIGRYSDVVRIPAGHDLVMTSGTPGLDENGAVPTEFVDEARLAWANVLTALERAGAGVDDIVSVRQWLTSPELVPAYAAVRAEVIKHRPTFMLAVVDQLVWPSIRVEIEVVAAVPSGRALSA